MSCSHVVYLDEYVLIVSCTKFVANKHYITSRVHYHLSQGGWGSSKLYLSVCVSCLYGLFLSGLAWLRGFNTPASAGGLNLPDKRVNPGCWLRSVFESPQGQLAVINLFQDPISWSDNICALLGLRANKSNPFSNSSKSIYVIIWP